MTTKAKLKQAEALLKTLQELDLIRSFHDKDRAIKLKQAQIVWNCVCIPNLRSVKGINCSIYHR